MKQSTLKATLALLLCGVMLLSGTLLVLHSGHACQETSCPVCPVIDSFIRLLMGVIAAVSWSLTAGYLLCRQYSRPPENRFVPEWTLVQRKVKLLN